MPFLKPARMAVYAILAVAIISSSLWLDAHLRADERLASAHLTYGRGCSGCVRTRPNVQVDVFADGTVVFQEDVDSDDRSFVTHLDADLVKAFFDELDTDAYWQEAPLRGSGPDAPYCYIIFVINKVGREGGCKIETRDANGNISLLYDHLKITQLETLLGLKQLRSFDHRNPPTGITIYKPSASYVVEPLPRIPPPPPPAG